jgi:hypothetical protein
MKKLLFTLGLMAFFKTTLVFATSGIFDDGIKIKANNGTETQYYFGIHCTDMNNGCSGSNSSTSPNFNAVSLGTNITSLKITWAEIRTFKNGTDDITGANLHYRVYKTGDNPAFTVESVAFGANLVASGDQRWTETLNLELVSSLITNTLYTLEIYSTSPFTFSGGSGTHLNNAAGSNFKLTFTTATVLANELTSFTAAKQNNQINLSWLTASEKENDNFSIERSKDGKNFTAIGQVKGAINSTVSKDYSFVDATPLKGINYYRLKSIELGGKTSFSKVVSVSLLDKNNRTLVYPNPVAESALRIEHDASADSELLLKVIDVTGRVIKAEKRSVVSGNNIISMDVSTLASGQYLISFDEQFVRFVKN